MKKFIKSIVEKSPKLAQFFRNSRDLLDRNEPMRLTPWGFKFAGHQAMAEGTFEPDETSLIQQLLQEVDVLVNVGANVGYYCCHALNLGKSVIAVEPNSRNIHYLMKNITENGWSQKAEIFPVALSAKSDILKIWGGGTSASLLKGWGGVSESYFSQVPVLTLDRIIGYSIRDIRALILIDVEGAEHAVLEGAINTLTNDPKPIWMVEIGTTEHQPEGVTINPHLMSTFEIFFQNGYKAVTADNTRTIITSEEVNNVFQKKKKMFTHNFLFYNP